VEENPKSEEKTEKRRLSLGESLTTTMDDNLTDYGNLDKICMWKALRHHVMSHHFLMPSRLLTSLSTEIQFPFLSIM
jgi:hypothetical protein